MKVNSKIEQDLRKRKIRPTAMRILVLRYLIEESQCTSLVELE
jgi:Fe2+ or Zn2+ uptake regulation protein